MPIRPLRRLEHHTPNVSAGELAAILEAEIVGDSSRIVRGPAPLELAREDQLSFVSHRKYVAAVAASRAGVLLVQHDIEIPETSAVVLRVPDARNSFQHVLTLFFPLYDHFEAGIHELAVVAEDAEISPLASIGPFCIVEDGARIGAGTILRSHVHIGCGASLGAENYIYPQVVVRSGVKIGDRCVLHSGVVIGSDGFGFVRVKDQHRKVAQVGTVVVGDDVEVGANTCIDRGALGDTVIGSGTKIDNLVHIGHNVRIGERVLIVAQVGLSGSSQIGDDVIMAGQSAVGGHLKVGARAHVGGRSGVLDHVPEEARVFGFPARDIRHQMRIERSLRNLPETDRKVSQLEAQVAELRTLLAGQSKTAQDTSEAP